MSWPKKRISIIYQSDYEMRINSMGMVKYFNTIAMRMELMIPSCRMRAFIVKPIRNDLIHPSPHINI